MKIWVWKDVGGGCGGSMVVNIWRVCGSLRS